jgi:ElaB/YqjD/DUF883 family membrane-anchored ribosome-binding protein
MNPVSSSISPSDSGSAIWRTWISNVLESRIVPTPSQLSQCSSRKMQNFGFQVLRCGPRAAPLVATFPSQAMTAKMPTTPKFGASPASSSTNPPTRVEFISFLRDEIKRIEDICDEKVEASRQVYEDSVCLVKDRAERRVSEAERRVMEAERRAVEAERRAAEAERRAEAMEQQCLELKLSASIRRALDDYPQ